MKIFAETNSSGTLCSKGDVYVWGCLNINEDQSKSEDQCEPIKIEINIKDEENSVMGDIGFF